MQNLFIDRIDEHFYMLVWYGIGEYFSILPMNTSMIKTMIVISLKNIPSSVYERDQGEMYSNLLIICSVLSKLIDVADESFRSAVYRLKIYKNNLRRIEVTREEGERSRERKIERERKTRKL